MGPKYAGPCQVIARVGEVAYRLRLPEGTRIHDVFHVGVLKPFRGPPPSTTPALPPLHQGRRQFQPDQVLRAQLRRGVWHVLVKWAGLTQADASWEPLEDFRAEFPTFQLEDKLFAEGGSDVMFGIVYRRRSG